MKNVRPGAALFALILASSCSGGGSAVSPSAAPSNVIGAPAASSSAPPPANYHFTFATAPAAPAGGIAVASDGRVYLNSRTSFMRYDGAFTVFPVSPPGGYSEAYSGGLQSLALGPNESVWEVLSGVLSRGGGAGAFAVLATGADTVTSYGESQTSGYDGDFYNVVASGPNQTMWLAHDTFKNYSPESAYQYGPADIYNAALALTNRIPACAGKPGCPVQTPFVAMTLGTDGNMYLASQPGVQSFIGDLVHSSQIYAVDPSSGTIAHTVQLPAGSQVTAMTAGPDGAIWFTDGGAAKIGRVSPSGAPTYFNLPAESGTAAGITPGSDNALWFTLPVSNQIGRIATNGSMTFYALPQSNMFPDGIAAGVLGGCVPGKLYITTQTGLAIFSFSS